MTGCSELKKTCWCPNDNHLPQIKNNGVPKNNNKKTILYIKNYNVQVYHRKFELKRTIYSLE